MMNIFDKEISKFPNVLYKSVPRRSGKTHFLFELIQTEMIYRDVIFISWYLEGLKQKIIHPNVEFITSAKIITLSRFGRLEPTLNGLIICDDPVPGFSFQRKIEFLYDINRLTKTKDRTSVIWLETPL